MMPLSPTPLMPELVPRGGKGIAMVSEEEDRGRDGVSMKLPVRSCPSCHAQLFTQRGADALGNPALELALDHERIDSPPQS